ncbi:hypothetical protein HNY73_008366 [Argiope bruennichi]|uniref:Transmembrane protein n=1 Tax=Argiope bruennichi TaxID=94029 RepID=A0A8T0FBE5_ARGBR|nr:hypothetical protein HNY73_008366 [Argiope bruennichi]
MKSLDFLWIVGLTLIGVLTLMTAVGCIPLNSKAAGWMSTAGEDSRSYSHLGGGSKFSKAPYVSQPPRSYQTTGSNASNKTLAAILFLTVFGIFATALFVILCSKITKKEQYDAVKGTIY